MMRWLCSALFVVAVLAWPTPALAQVIPEVAVGKPFTVTAVHDGMNHQGSRLYLDNVMITERQVPSTCAAGWSWGSLYPTDSTLRATLLNGVHLGQGYGSEYRCVSGVVWVWSGPTFGWYRWTGTTWVSSAQAPPTMEIAIQGVTQTTGQHEVRVAVYAGLAEERSIALVIEAVKSGEVIEPPISKPTGLRVQP